MGNNICSYLIIIGILTISGCVEQTSPPTSTPTTTPTITSIWWSSPTYTPTATEEVYVRVLETNKTYLLFDAHVLDRDNKIIKAPAIIIDEDKMMYLDIPTDANILEGYFERWCSILGMSYENNILILFPINAKAETLYEKKINYNDITNVYPFSIDVSKYRGKRIFITVGYRPAYTTNTKQLATDLIKAAQSQIDNLEREGIETSYIEGLLGVARNAYDSGDYINTARFATEAKSRADITYHNQKTFIVAFKFFSRSFLPVIPEMPMPSVTPTHS